MSDDERLDLARRLAFVLELGKVNDFGKPPAEIRQLPYRPLPEPEPRVERPEPMNEYAIEPLGTTWPVEAWERVARVRLNQIPAAYQPEGAFEVRGSKPRFVLTEAPDRWRERVVAMGYNLQAAA